MLARAASVCSLLVVFFGAKALPPGFLVALCALVRARLLAVPAVRLRAR
jgi:hypothetical protein